MFVKAIFNNPFFTSMQMSAAQSLFVKRRPPVATIYNSDTAPTVGEKEQCKVQTSRSLLFLWQELLYS